MADTSTNIPLPGITALPPTTARQICSGQVLVDTSSVVKELIDNALDARAKSIFVDMAANTIDSIQVKDDGHGIPAEDRALVCRRYCTSKIRDLHDLKDVGGRWLGFRGEALSSMAELSSTVSVTTRVEGEPVAVKLKYGRDGELVSTERDSHPVGTTVKATQFFELIPVRKQTAVKNAAKTLAKVRRLMQAYALARPAVRFRLHVSKAKNTKGDFMYAPKANCNLEDAVLKVISKDCALQCDWTALESDDFEIHAFLPKPTANGLKISYQGAFISVDSRPVSNTRGTMKKIVTAFKERLRKSNRSLATVKDPFFCMNIICPLGSYDPNIEPAKDDVMFDEGEVLLTAVDKLFRSYYPEAVQETYSDLPSCEQSHLYTRDEEPMRTQTPISVYEDPPGHPEDQPMTDVTPEPSSEQPRWRSIMYGIDEDDMEYLQENQPPVLEEEEGTRAAAISNPWTIARMNAPIRPKTVVSNGQLLSPAKSHGRGQTRPSSPAPLTPARQPLAETMTLQISSRVNVDRSSLDRELEQGIQHVDRSHSEELLMTNTCQPRTEILDRSTKFDSTMSNATEGVEESTSSSRSLGSIGNRPVPSSTAPKTQRSPTKAQSQRDGSASTPADGPNDTWFGQPMRGSVPVQPSQRQKRKASGVPLFPRNESRSVRKSNASAYEQRIEEPLFSENNTDIRTFFGHNVQHLGRTQPSSSRASSAEPPSGSKHVRDQLLLNSDNTSLHSRNMSDQLRAYTERERPSSQPLSVSGASFTLPYRSQIVKDAMQMYGTQDFRSPPSKMGSQFQAYETAYAHASPHRSLSADSHRRPIIPQRSTDIRSALDLSRVDQPSSNACAMAAHFKAYQDRETLTPPNFPHRHDPRIASAHETRTPRRHTTDAAQRTKSSKLPLGRVPHGYHVQNLVLPLQTSIASIMYSALKIDMRCNSLEWGYAADGAYDGFAKKVGETRIMRWVVKIDGILHERCGRLDGVKTRGMLHETLQRGLDERMGEGEGMDGVEESGPVTMMEGANSVSHDPLLVHHTAPDAKDDTAEFDLSQFIDIDMDRIDDEEDAHSVTMADERPDEEFGQDIDDDMLMDL